MVVGSGKSLTYAILRTTISNGTNYTINRRVRHLNP